MGGARSLPAKGREQGRGPRAAWGRACGRWGGEPGEAWEVEEAGAMWGEEE